MGIIHELVKDIPIPKMLKVKQTFADERLSNVEETLQQELDQEHIRNTVKPGMEIAIAVGSRGVDKIVEVTAQTVKFLQDLGAKPFIVPSMGSHGGATAEGQQAVLAHLGVTEETVNAEIRSSMEEIGRASCRERVIGRAGRSITRQNRDRRNYGNGVT